MKKKQKKIWKYSEALITTLLVSLEKIWQDKSNDIKKITNNNPSRSQLLCKDKSRKKNIVNVIFNKKECGKGDVVFLNLYNQC